MVTLSFLLLPTTRCRARHSTSTCLPPKLRGRMRLRVEDVTQPASSSRDSKVVSFTTAFPDATKKSS